MSTDLSNNPVECREEDYLINALHAERFYILWYCILTECGFSCRSK